MKPIVLYPTYRTLPEKCLALFLPFSKKFDFCHFEERSDEKCFNYPGYFSLRSK